MKKKNAFGKVGNKHSEYFIPAAVHEEAISFKVKGEMTKESEDPAPDRRDAHKKPGS